MICSWAANDNWYFCWPMQSAPCVGLKLFLVPSTLYDKYQPWLLTLHLLARRQIFQLVFSYTNLSSSRKKSLRLFCVNPNKPRPYAKIQYCQPRTPFQSKTSSIVIQKTPSNPNSPHILRLWVASEHHTFHRHKWEAPLHRGTTSFPTAMSQTDHEWKMARIGRSIAHRYIVLIVSHGFLHM